MSERQAPAAPAGWYPDLSGSHRYWNGSEWVGRELPPGQAVPTSPSRGGPNISASEVVCSILLPILGFIWGLLELKERPRAGWQMIVVSTAAAVIAYALFLR